ncbi:MAG: esterase/lipase family protein [Bdellovibrionales bacterium]
MSTVHVFFIRGLSTNGSDDAYFSIFNFGPMSKQLARAFHKRNIQFHPVNGTGAGTMRELAARARDYLENHPVWRDPNIPVHIFGHSAGGLVARLLAAQPGIPPGKILSVITVAAPNQGSAFAEHCKSIPEKYPRSAKFLRSCGYDIGNKTGFFDDLLPVHVRKYMAEHAQLPREIRTASVICHAPRAEWCWPLRLFYVVKAFKDFTQPSDGIVERDTQAFGEVIAELNIDHFRQIGIFGKREKFAKMCDVLADFFVQTQNRK